MQNSLNSVKVNTDRIGSTLWTLRDEIYKITGVIEETEKEMGEYDEDENDEDEIEPGKDPATDWT